MDDYNNAESFLWFFNNAFFRDGVRELHHALNEFPEEIPDWERLKVVIKNRGFAPGEPQKLISDIVNISLYESTDDEAYRWFDLLVLNVERKDRVIDEYHGGSQSGRAIIKRD